MGSQLDSTLGSVIEWQRFAHGKLHLLHAATNAVVCSGNLLILASTLLVLIRLKFGRRWFQELLETLTPLDSPHAGFSEE